MQIIIAIKKEQKNLRYVPPQLSGQKIYQCMKENEIHQTTK